LAYVEVALRIQKLLCLFDHNFGVLEDIFVSGDSLMIDVLDVIEAIYAAINGLTEFKHTTLIMID
jgi:hypothetical protein